MNMNLLAAQAATSHHDSWQDVATAAIFLAFLAFCAWLLLR